MTWTFQLSATQTHLFFQRVLQVFETQRVNIRSFTGESSQNTITILVRFDCELQHAYRIEALLHKLSGIHRITVQCHP